MASKSFRHEIDESLSALTLTPEMKQRIQAGVAADQKTRSAGARKRPVTFRRAVAGVLAACMLFAFGVTVVASVVPSFEVLLQAVGQDMRHLLRPVNRVKEKNGIRMEIVAAVNDEDSVVIYFTLQDTTGQGRIGADTTLQGEHFNQGFAGFPLRVDFDEKTGIATFRLEYFSSVEDLRGGKITFVLDGLLLGEEEREGYDLGITLADILAANPQPVAGPENGTTHGYGATNMMDNAVEEIFAHLDTWPEPTTLPLLSQQEQYQAGFESPDWMNITSAGVVDGWLHVQVKPDGIVGNLNSCWLDLRRSGEEMNSGLAQVVVDVNRISKDWERYDLHEYKEWVLQIPEDVDPAELRLVAGGTTYSEYLKGPWSVTFKLDDALSGYAWDVNLDMGGWQIDRIEVTPIGVQVVGYGEQQEEDEGVFLEVLLKDGTHAEFFSSMASASSSEGDDRVLVVLRNSYMGLIDPEEVAAVILNDVEYRVEDASGM